jgi:phosphoribosylanthranilate isomerase
VVASVKICGLTRPEDAARAAGAGAAYLGVVFAGGPRQVSVARAAEVVAASRGVPVLGVFSTQSVEQILATAREAALAGAQLHGPYSRDDAERLRRAGLTVWRVVRIAMAGDLELLADAADKADAVLVEPRVAHADGGTGIALDTTIAVEARRRLAGVRMALAGGLTPETVGALIALVGPDVADVSSGVESHPGLKDHDKIARFLEAVLGRSPTVG